jgi:hypothetical protein
MDSTLTKVRFVGLVSALVLNGIILSWVNKLEKKCECSADWRRDYIKYFSIVSIIFAFANAFMPNLIKTLLPLLMIFGLAGLVNLGSILSYIPGLKKKQCNCAIEKDWRDNFIFWWIIISLILPVLASGAAAFMLTRK